MIPFPSPHLKLRHGLHNRTEVLDTLRRKYVAFTPEEEVRQSLIAYLIHEKGYPQGVIAVEYGFTLNGLQKRADIVVFSASGVPSILVECKAPQIALSQAILDQASRYNQLISAPYICIYNGVSLMLFELNSVDNQYNMLSDWPDYATL